MKNVLKVMLGLAWLTGLVLPAWSQQVPKKEDYTAVFSEFPDSLFSPYYVYIGGWDYDSQGNVWLACYVGEYNNAGYDLKWTGLVEFDGTNWKLYPYDSGYYVLYTKALFSVVVGPHDNKWACNESSGSGKLHVIKFKNGVFTPLITIDENNISDIIGVRFDNKGYMWVIGYRFNLWTHYADTYIMKYDSLGNRLEKFYFPTTGLELPYFDQRNRKWFPSDNELFIYNDTTWTHWTFEDLGLSSNRVKSIVFDQKDNAWITYDGGGHKIIKISPDGSKKLVRIKIKTYDYKWCLFSYLREEKVGNKDYFWSGGQLTYLIVPLGESLEDSVQIIGFLPSDFQGIGTATPKFSPDDIIIDSQGRKLIRCSWDNPDTNSVNEYKYGIAIISKSPITGVEDNPSPVLPNSYFLYQNYPNPFNASTTIEYSLAKPGKVKLEVYDSRGQRVKILVDEYQQSGVHQVRFNASRLASGIYFYLLETNNFRQTRKMLLLK